jgi:hypothetical protein
MHVAYATLVGHLLTRRAGMGLSLTRFEVSLFVHFRSPEGDIVTAVGVSRRTGWIAQHKPGGRHKTCAHVSPSGLMLRFICFPGTYVPGNSCVALRAV